MLTSQASVWNLGTKQGTPAIGAAQEFPALTSASNPADVTQGADGNVWFTEYAGNKIGRSTPSGTITEYPIPTANSHPRWITLGFRRDGGSPSRTATTSGA